VIPFAEVEELLDNEEACRQIGTVLVNMGATPITDPAFRREIALLQERHAEIAVIAISDRDEPQMLREAYALGLRGYIPTSLDIAVFLQALRLVMAGGSFFPAETMLQTTPAPDLESGSVNSQEGDDPGGKQQHGTFPPR
jgi:DNA-binding NarL/FixJ family response regulator